MVLESGNSKGCIWAFTLCHNMVEGITWSEKAQEVEQLRAREHVPGRFHFYSKATPLETQPLLQSICQGEDRGLGK
jgi:hypothetical protein